MSYAVEPSIPEVFRAIEVIPVQERERFLFRLWGEDSTREQLAGTSRTLWYNTTPVAIIGMQVIVPGVADLWSLLTPRIYEHRVAVMRFHLRWIRFAIEHFRLHRVQTYVHEDAAPAFHWLERTGFVREAVLRCFIERETYHLMARILG